MSKRATYYGRKVDFGLRVHVIVRETEAEARAYARQLVSKLDVEVGEALRKRSLDINSAGLARQLEMRELADEDGFVEPLLWKGIERTRSCRGGALVGAPDQIVEKLNRYIDPGIRSFIFSVYPHQSEAELFARYVLPRLEQGKLAALQGKI